MILNTFRNSDFVSSGKILPVIYENILFPHSNLFYFLIFLQKLSVYYKFNTIFKFGFFLGVEIANLFLTIYIKFLLLPTTNFSYK